MKFKKIVSVLLAICCLGSVAACGETSGYAKAGAPDYSEASGEIVLDSWLAPRASEQAMAEYAECGYNMMHLGNDSIMPETGGGINGNSLSASAKQKMNDDLDRYLTLGEKYGVKAILSMNARNMNQTDYMDFSYMDKIISPTLEKWKDKDTFYGYMPLDEPRFLDLPITVKQTATGGERAYSKIIDWANDDYTYFASKYPNKKYEIVLLGITNQSAGNRTKLRRRLGNVRLLLRKLRQKPPEKRENNFLRRVSVFRGLPHGRDLQPRRIYGFARVRRDQSPRARRRKLDLYAGS